MAAVFDLAKTRIGNKRDQVEDALRDRVDKFETKVGIMFKVHILTQCGPFVFGASVSNLICISSEDIILIGCDKSCDIRIIDDIILRCQQGHILQQA